MNTYFWDSSTSSNGKWTHQTPPLTYWKFHMFFCIYFFKASLTEDQLKTNRVDMGKTKAFSIPSWKYIFIRESTDLGKFQYTLDPKVYNPDSLEFCYLQFARWHLCEKRAIVEESIIWSPSVYFQDKSIAYPPWLPLAATDTIVYRSVKWKTIS